MGWAAEMTLWCSLSVVTGIVLLAYGHRPRRRLVTWPGGILLLFGLGCPALYAFAGWRENLYPWNDWSAPHAVVHVENETGVSARLSWRFAHDETWNPLLLPDGRDPAPWTDEPSTIHQIAVLFDGTRTDAEGWAVVLRLEVEREPLVVTTRVRVGPGDHLRLRVAPRRVCSWSRGREDWIGRPRFERERAIPFLGDPGSYWVLGERDDSLGTARIRREVELTDRYEASVDPRVFLPISVEESPPEGRLVAAHVLEPAIDDDAGAWWIDGDTLRLAWVMHGGDSALHGAFDLADGEGWMQRWNHSVPFDPVPARLAVRVEE